MEALADVSDGAALRSPSARWSTPTRLDRGATRGGLDSDRRVETRDLLMDDAARARTRIAEGIELLATRDEL
jgi:hypothetical protein